MKINNKGFTLIEILAVVSLMAIVLALSFKAYNYITDISKEKAVAISVDNIKSAAELYSKENKDLSRWGEYNVGDYNYLYYCVSIQDLINDGFFGEELLNKRVKANGGINNESIVKIIKNASNMSIVNTELTKASDVNECLKTTWNEINNSNPIQVSKYHIEFDANGGDDDIGYKDKEIGEAITLPLATKEGYLFAGWFTNRFGGKKIGDAEETYTPQHDMILYAHWLADSNFKRVKIKLDMDGGDLDSETAEGHIEGLGKNGSLLTINGSEIIHEIIHGDKSELLNWKGNIVKEGYSVADEAWCTKKNGNGKCYNLTTEYKSTKFCTNTKEDCEITLYANWVVSKVNILFYANGGELKEEHGSRYNIDSGYVTKDNKTYIQTIEYGKSLGENGLLNWNNASYLNMYKTGYTINSNSVWCIDQETCFNQTDAYEGSRFCDAKYGDCTLELYANWISNTYTITLDNKGATTVGTSTIYEEYNKNWYLDSNKTKTMTSEENPIVKPTKAGYVFDGYYTEENGEGTQVITEEGYIVGNKETEFSENATLHANWIAQDYTINYYLGNTDGTEPTLLASQEYTAGENNKLIPFADFGEVFPYGSGYEGGNKGWSFYGWSTSKTGTTKKYDDNASVDESSYSSEINLYALGKKEYRFNSGIAPKSIKKIETQVWNPYSTNSDYLTSIPIASPDTLTSWEFIGYMSGSDVVTNDTVCITSDKVGTNYKPKYNDCNTGTLRSKYKRTLTVSFNANGGSGTTASVTKIQRYNSGYGSKDGTTNKNAALGSNEITLPASSFTRTNYTFTKWRTAASSGTYYDENDIFTGIGDTVSNTTISQTLYAQWEQNSSEVYLTYNANGHGTAPARVTMTYAAATKAANAITATGYTFTKWCRNANGSGTCYNAGATVKAANTTPTQMTLYAIWTEKSAALTYYANGHGTAPSAATMTYSRAQNAAGAITATGYTFNGWNTKSDGSGTNYAAGAQVKAANVEPSAINLYAKWTEKSATLTYNANGHGTAPSSVTMKYSTATKAAAAITAGGYTFGGWNTKSDGSGTNYAAGAQVKAANVEPTAKTLYAKWTAVDPTISFSSGGTSSSPTKIRSGKTITVTCNTDAGVNSFDTVDDKSDHGSLTKPSTTQWKRTIKLSSIRDGAYIKATCKSKNGKTKTVTKYYNVKEAAPELTFSKGSTSSSNRTSVTKGTVITITCTSNFGFKSFTTKDDTGDTGSLDSSTTTKRVRKIKLGSVRSSAYIKATCTADDDKSTTSTRYYKVTSSSSGGSSSSSSSAGLTCGSTMSSGPNEAALCQ